MLDEVVVRLLKLEDLSEAEQLIDGEATFSISFLQKMENDTSLFQRVPIVTNKFYLNSYDLEDVQEEKSALYGKELALITTKEKKKRILLAIVCVGLFILTIMSFNSHTMLSVISLAILGKFIIKFFDNWKDTKQHTYRLLEIIYNTLSFDAKKLFLAELKKSDFIELKNPTDSLKTSNKGVDFISGSIMLKSSEVIKFFYNEVLSEKTK